MGRRLILDIDILIAYERGAIDRPSATDRRARIIACTPEGEEMARKSQEIVDRVHREAVDSLPEPARSVLIDALSSLAVGYLATPDTPLGVRRARQQT
jgi:MarR family transcriptional regulator for hemolysin